MIQQHHNFYWLWINLLLIIFMSICYNYNRIMLCIGLRSIFYLYLCMFSSSLWIHWHMLPCTCHIMLIAWLYLLCRRVFIGWGFCVRCLGTLVCLCFYFSIMWYLSIMWYWFYSLLLLFMIDGLFIYFW